MKTQTTPVSTRKAAPLPISKNIPNAETVKALEDSTHKRELTSYTSVDEMFAELWTDD